MIDSYEKLLALEYLVLFLADYLIVTTAHALTKRFSNTLLVWTLINIVGLICVGSLAFMTPDRFGIIYAGGITRLGLLTICLLVFSLRFVERYVGRWEDDRATKLRIAVIRVIPIVLTFGLGYGLIQLETDKKAAQRNLADYQARVLLFQMMQNDPDVWPVVAAFRRNFPQEANQLVEKFTESTIQRRQPQNGAIDYRPGEVLGMVSQFGTTQSANISRSSGERLISLFAAQKEYFEWLDQFPSLCALVLKGDKEALRSLNDPTLNEAASPDVSSRVSRMLSAMLEAAGEGRRQPVKRDFAKVPQDLVSTIAALPAKQKLIFDGELSGSASEKCEAQIGVNQAVSELPQHDVVFWTAYFYALRSAT